MDIEELNKEERNYGVVCRGRKDSFELFATGRTSSTLIGSDIISKLPGDNETRAPQSGLQPVSSHKTVWGSDIVLQ